jgi:hypothetical protein
MVIFPHNFPRSGQSAWSGRSQESSYSGLARAGQREHLAVHDCKGPDGNRVSSLNGNSMALEDVRIDWSRTGLPHDLEAIAGVDGQKGEFMAVEGSRSKAPNAHLFLFDYAQGEGKAVKRFDLPKLPYQIEGMVTTRRDDGDVLVVLGGRGDGNSREGTLHWANYHPDSQSLSWSKQGQQGISITLPESLGEGERPISDLHLTREGDLWASGCVDNGDTGPFESLVYRVGSLQADSPNPVTLTLDHPHRIPGQKIEALDANPGHESHLLAGTDNESFGGSLQSLLAQTTEHG